MVVDVGLDLAPEWRACAAPAENDAIGWDAEFAEEREGVVEGKGDAFEDGADEVGAGGGGGDSGKGGASTGVEMWSSFAEEIGRPEQAVGGRRRSGGKGG